MNNVVKNSKTSPKKSVTAKQLAKSNLTKRKNPDWDNLDRGYRYLTLDMKLPHDLAVAVMGNVVEESLGDYKSVLKSGRGRGLIQWDGRNAPNSRYSLWGSIWASVAKPANVYDSTTDTVKNYWAPWGGLKGDEVRLKFIKAPLKEKARIYAESYLRPGKPRIADRQLSTMQLDSIYNPRIKDIIVLKQGGKMNILEFLKKGSGIHIKKENKGKFTDYCGGKVTSECIAKGKRSPNAAIRKRATFAANARKWKHEKGGKAFVNRVNVLDSNPNAYKYVKKKYKMALQGTKMDWTPIILSGMLLVGNGINTYMLNKSLNKLAESIKTKSEAEKQKARNEAYSNFLKAFDISPTTDSSGNTINHSDIEARNQAYNYASSAEYDDSAVRELLNNIELLKSLAWSDYFLNLAGTATSIIGNYAANKALSKNGVPESYNKNGSPSLSLTGLKNSKVLNNTMLNSHSVNDMKNLMQISDR